MTLSLLPASLISITNNTMSQKIRIKLKSYDHTLVEKSAEKIVKNVKATGAIVSGPIPLPTRTTFITDEQGIVTRIIGPKEIKVKEHAEQILK